MSDDPAAQQALAASEGRYRGLFQDSPVSLWEEDFSAVKGLVDALLDGGVTDLRRHLEDHPEVVAQCAAAVEIIEVNQATLALLEVERKDALLKGLPYYFTADALAVFREELIALAEGKGSFEGEATLHSETGRALHVVVKLSIAPGHEATWSRVIVSLVDVTARRQAEAALRESRREWQTLVSNLPGFFYRCRNDRSWTMEVLSEGCERLTGYAVSDLLGNRRLAYNDLIHRHDREPVWEAVQAAVARRAPFELQYRIAALDGAEKWVWEQGCGIFSTAGELLALEGYITDISERIHAERELQRLNRALQTVNECTRVLMHAADEAEFLQEVCRLMVEIGGYRLAWIGFAEDDAARSVRPVAKAGQDEAYLDTVIISWGDTETGRGPTGTAIRTGQPCAVQDMAHEVAYRPWREEAARRGLAASIALPLRGQKGRPIGALNVYSAERQAFDREEVELLTGLADDVAYGILSLRARQARLQAEERLRKLSAAVEQSPVSVVITDVRGAIEYANPKFTEVTGYSLAEVVGQNPRLLKSGEMPPEAYRGLWASITSGESWQGEFHNKKKDGALFWERASISPIRDEAGEITHFVAVKEDVTGHKRVEEERRVLEAQLRQAQKMETIGTLAGGIAHDFNNLLQAIIGYGGMGLEDTLPESCTHRHLQRILTAAESARDLVQQILTFARKGGVERCPVRVDHVVDEVTALLRATLPATIELRQLIDPDCRAVSADVSQMHQVVMNLCTNACHAMRDGGGVLEIHAGNVTVTEAVAAAHSDLTAGPYVRLRVTDTGMGIDPIHRDRIFDPFFTTKGPQEGTGLGLSVVHGIVAAQGGAIVVDSELGRGTTFDIFLLPVEAQPAPRAVAVPRGDTGHGHILYVEDDPSIAALVEEMLRRSGYRVTLSGSGSAALETILGGRERFDLVVTDHAMPGLTGVDLAERLREVAPGLPIILVTALQDAIPHERLAGLGIRTLLYKPVQAGQLRDAIRTVMDRPLPQGR